MIARRVSFLGFWALGQRFVFLHEVFDGVLVDDKATVFR
jgi:hypothetical protein